MVYAENSNPNEFEEILDCLLRNDAHEETKVT